MAAKKKTEEETTEPHISETHIPFVTGNLDTSTEGFYDIQTQVQAIVDYNASNHVEPNVITLPENAVTEGDAFGIKSDMVDEDQETGNYKGNIDPVAV